MRMVRWFGVGVLVAALAVVSPQAASGDAAAASWPTSGHDLANSRSNPDEHTIGTANVARLVPKWSRDFAGVLAATPAVVGGVVYLADRSGNLTAMSAATGAVKWSKAVSGYTGIAGDVGRATPAVANGRLIFGDQPGTGTHDGAHVMAVDAATGNLVWDTVVDTTRTAKITGSVTVDGDVAYVGVSSSDESDPDCCHFRGNVVALNANTGAILWRTYTVPSGYTGGAVFSSGIVVDHTTGLMYIGTGNNYSVPAGVCGAPDETGCSPPAANDYVDSLLALDLDTGAVRWALRTAEADASTNHCRNTTVCGPDYGFAAAPNLFTTTIGGATRRLVGIGEKSGVYWAVDAATGALVWSRQVGPGGSLGGVEWGTASDGARIYVSITNSAHVTWTLQPSGATTTGGFFSALNPATGAILWQTPDPQRVGDFGFVSAANGVVYAGSSAGSGPNMYALDAATGAIRWSYAAGGSVMGGAAIVDGVVYWAAGYYTVSCPSAGTCGTPYRLYAFALPAAGSAPTAPTGVVAQQTGATSIGLTWAPPASAGGSDVTAYVVTRNGTVVATLPPGARSYSLTGLGPGVTYTVGVAARNTSATGPAVTNTVKASRRPTAPTGFTATQSGASSAVLSWAAPVSSGASAVTGYVVTRNGTDTAGHGAYSKSLPASARSFTMTALANGRTYTFTVSATNSLGPGTTSSASVIMAQKATAPTQLAALQVAPRDVTISWAPPVSAGAAAITGYRVARDGSDVDGVGAYSKIVPAGTRSFTFTRLQQFVPYTMTVQAVTAQGTGAAASRSVTASS